MVETEKMSLITAAALTPCVTSVAAGTASRKRPTELIINLETSREARHQRRLDRKAAERIVKPDVSNVAVGNVV